MQDQVDAHDAIHRMLNPRNIAVVGASDRMGYGGRVVSNLLQGGYPGEIFPINPHNGEIQGLRAYPNVQDVPGPVDLAVLAVPSVAIPQVVEDCGLKGIRAVAIISAGFAEQGPEGLERQDMVVAVARRFGLRIAGPNCLGIANIPERVFAAAPFEPAWSRPSFRALDGRISVVSQSGALAFSTLLARSQERGIGLRYLISVGNQADLTLTDFVDYLVEADDRTEAIALFMEGLPRNGGRRFLEVTRRAALIGKPIVALKVGRSAQSAASARSHTAVLTGNDATYDGAFRQGGVVRVDDLDDLWEVGNLLSRVAPRTDLGVGIAASSGGLNSLLVDLLGAEGVSVPSIELETIAKISTVLAGRGHAANPTDASGHLVKESFQAILASLGDDPAIDLILVGLTQLASGSRSLEAARQITEAYAKSSVPYVVMWGSSALLDGLPGRDNASFERIREVGIPLFHQPGQAARALGLSQQYALRRELIRSSASVKGHDLVPRLLAGTGYLYALELIAQIGIPIARTRACDSLSEALGIVEELGYPVVLKIDAPGLLHKTEAAGVRLHIRDRVELTAAYEEIWGATACLGTERRVLVQEEVLDGVEFLLGGVVDPIFGPVVTLASGGTWVEITKDVTARVAPVDGMTALAMVHDLRAAPLLEGLRGQPVRDKDALVDAVVRFSHLLVSLGEAVEEIEVNPLFVLVKGQGVSAVDAAIVTAPLGEQEEKSEVVGNEPLDAPSSDMS